ncbi:uncharacterized protein LOC124795947 [Schistocerca piceifrons]|uniref:uncharacterized protein LOC124795947 n=1 Tax=Schistocerca piceifrons TaxID=274613 RepID=UPI001F5EF0B5|nr:uncharacterized protein LOC124795947 [Schistocerca piceifrons]
MITITVNGETPPDEAPAAVMERQEEESGTSGRVLELQVEMRAGGGGAAGLHVTRTQWDVFPWVSAVDAGSPAEAAGLRAGDCLLAAAGRHLLGVRVAAVADAVRRAAATGRVPLSVWRPDAKHAAGCSDESVCCGPMPLTLQRLSGAVSGIVAGLECPVCLETVSPPASQCVHGHLLCPRCRPAAADRCPVCRVHMARGRSLLADHVFRTLADAFQVGPDPAPGALADTIFGRSREPRKKKKKPQREREAPPTNRLLARLLGKWSSVECLTPSSSPSPAQSCPLSHADRLKSLSSSELPTAPSSLTPATSQDSVASEEDESRRRPPPQLFRCPCERSCPAQLEADALGTHARRDHGHVLAAMPDAAAAVRLPPWPDEIATLTHAGHIFYLKVEEAADALEVWLWVAGGEPDCARYEVRASLSCGQRPRGRRLSRTVSGAELTAPVFTGRALPLAVAAAQADPPPLRLPLAAPAAASCLQLEVRDLLHEPEVTTT